MTFRGLLVRPTRLPSVSHVVASRKAPHSPYRRIAWFALAGSVIAAAVAGIGGGLLLPIGLAVTVAGGVLTAVFAWREVKATRVAMLAEQARDARRASELLREAGRLNLGVVTVLTARNSELVRELELSRIAAGELQQETAALRGDKAALSVELAQRSEELEELRSNLADVKELIDADVVTLPVVTEPTGTEVDLWTEDGYPTVVLLEALANPPVPEAEERKHA